MAIEWGSGSGAGNPQYAGIDVTVSGTSAVVDFYVKSQYRISYNGITASWSGAATGSTRFNHVQSGGQAVKVGSVTVSGTPGQTKSITLSLSAVYNGGAPSTTRSWTFPAAGKLAPNAPSVLSVNPYADTETDVSWTDPSTTNRPAEWYRLERYGYNHPGAGYVLQYDRLTGTSLSGLGGTADNDLYSLRIRAENTAGVSAWTYSIEWRTTPRKSDNVTLRRRPDGSLISEWTDQANFNTQWDVQWLENGVPAGAVVQVDESIQNLVKTSPNPMVTHAIKVRAVVPLFVSGWVTSNSISLLAKPGRPTGLSGGVADPSKAITGSWRHNATDGSAQTSSRVRYRKTGTGTWTTEGIVATSAQEVVWAASKFASLTGGIEWQVQTKGEHVDWSDWSDTAAYVWSTTPVVSITQPPGSTWASPVLRLKWTSSTAQSQYQADLLNSASQVLESVAQSGSTQDITFSTRLITATSYLVRVSSRNPDGLWSAPVERSFTATFPKPAGVDVNVVWDDERGWASCTFTQLARVGSEVVATEVDLYRSDNGTAGPWVLVAERVPLTATIIDTEPSVDGSAVWVARSRNVTNSTEQDGRPATTQIRTEQGYLSGGDGFDIVVALKWDPDPELSTSRPDRQVIYLDGGNKPRRVLVDTPKVVKVLTYAGRLYAEHHVYEALTVLEGPHLYRDPDGRKLYGAIRGETPVKRGIKAIWWEVSFTIEEADHDRVLGSVVPS